MRVLIFSDIHGDVRALEKIVATPADLYISAGDLSTFGRALDRCGEALRGLGERLWVIPGNHETTDDNRALCRKFGFVDFHRQVRELSGANGVTHWLGLGYSNPTPFNTPGEYTEEEITQALAELESRLPPADARPPVYCVIHFPPQRTKLDEVRPGTHPGSPVLRAWMERVQPVALYCGHIHECAGRSDTLGGTQCFNVGKAGRVVEI